jgi:hypothetical protein
MVEMESKIMIDMHLFTTEPGYRCVRLLIQHLRVDGGKLGVYDR